METNIFLYICILTSLSVNAHIIIDHVEKPNILGNCAVQMVQEWSFENVAFDLTLVNVNGDVDLSALKDVEGLRIISRSYLWNTQNIYNVAYIVMSESYKELTNGLNKMSSDKFWNPKARFLIILQHLEDDLPDIKTLLYNYNMYNVTLISYKANDYAIYQYKASSSNFCTGTVSFELVSWCSEYLEGKHLPKLVKVGDLSLRGCEFKFVTRNLWPYTNLDGVGIEGLEQYYVQMLERYSGIKAQLVLFGKNDRYGQTDVDYPVVMIKKVEKNEFEGMLGGYSTEIQNLGKYNVSYLYPLLVDKKVYVFAHADTLGRWEGIFARSSYAFFVVGILLLMLCVAATLLSVFRTRERNIIRDILLVLGCIMNRVCVKSVHSRLSQKLVLGSIFLLALMFPCILQGFLFSWAKNPRLGYEPTDVKEIDRYTLILYSELAGKYSVRDCGSRLQCLLEIKNNKDKSLYTIVSKQFFSVVSWQLADEQCNPAVYHLEDTYSTELRTIFLRRGSILQETFEHLLRRIVTTGLVWKHYVDMSYSEWFKFKPCYLPEHTPLGMDDVYESFEVLFMGYILSVIVFICEYKLKGRSINLYYLVLYGYELIVTLKNMLKP